MGKSHQLAAQRSQLAGASAFTMIFFINIKLPLAPLDDGYKQFDSTESIKNYSACLKPNPEIY
jgi:hypothetical protein